MLTHVIRFASGGLSCAECGQYAITDRDNFDVIAIGLCISNCGSVKVHGENIGQSLIQGDRLSQTIVVYIEKCEMLHLVLISIEIYLNKKILILISSLKVIV